MLCIQSNSALYIFRLFFGDPDKIDPLVIASIRMVEDQINLESYVAAITALDNVLSNNLFNDNEITKDSKQGIIIKHLIKHHVNLQSTTSKRQLPSYVYQTFESFVNHKRKIDIDINNANTYIEDEELSEELFDNLAKGWRRDHSVTAWVDAKSDKNLIKSSVLRMFINVKDVIITGTYRNAFSLIGFLSRIQNTSIKNVTIHVEPEVCSFLKSSTEFKLIKTEYEAKKFNIKVDNDQVIIT